MKTKRPRVALLVESSRGYGRGLLQGIATYVRTRTNWSLYHIERTLGEAAPAWLERWRGQGIIARIESRALLREIRKLALPTVDLRGLFELPDIPVVDSNDGRIVELAVTHLREYGHTQLAFCGFAGANYSEARLAAFRALTEPDLDEKFVYETPSPPRALDTSHLEAQSLSHERELGEWLAALPKPVGLVACNDIRAQQVLSACRERGIAVPEQVAVIGVDNDELICELCDPTLTSVAPDTAGIGFRAAELLDLMLHGKKPTNMHEELNPLGVALRQSTHARAIANAELAAALRVIREHACEGLRVSDLAQRLKLSRSTLERLFLRELKRTPKFEIRRVQLDRARQMLAETSDNLHTIAVRTGFKHAEYLVAVFKQQIGKTPAEYRAQAQRERLAQAGWETWPSVRR